MSESKNIAALTGRGFHSTLEAFVVCEAVEKSNLLDDAKKVVITAIVRELANQGIVEVKDLMAKITDYFKNDVDIIGAVEALLKSIGNP